jgi:hypothetical protein
MKCRFLALLAVLAMIAGTGIVAAAPAFALTERFDASWEGAGNYLASCGAQFDTVYFIKTSQGGCYNVNWNYQLYELGAYFIHPANNNNLCLTDSTTQFGVEKIEECGDNDNQVYYNPHNSAGYYLIQSLYYDANLCDSNGPGQTGPAGLGSDSYGYNGCTMGQGAPG